MLQSGLLCTTQSSDGFFSYRGNNMHSRFAGSTFFAKPALGKCFFDKALGGNGQEWLEPQVQDSLFEGGDCLFLAECEQLYQVHSTAAKDNRRCCFLLVSMEKDQDNFAQSCRL